MRPPNRNGREALPTVPRAMRRIKAYNVSRDGLRALGDEYVQNVLRLRQACDTEVIHDEDMRRKHREWPVHREPKEVPNEWLRQTEHDAKIHQ